MVSNDISVTSPFFFVMAHHITLRFTKIQMQSLGWDVKFNCIGS